MKVEFLNLNGDAKLDPEIKPAKLSRDGKTQPPAYCLPWVEATRYSISIKANFEYWIRKTESGIQACAAENGHPLPVQENFLPVPEGAFFVPRDAREEKDRVVSVGHSPAFSSPWQEKHAHSVTLKLGISWWTPPGWGLFFTSAVHRNEEFRVVEGLVRTDLWHRDIPIVIQPLQPELKIPKYSVVASAILVSAEAPELSPAEAREEKMKEISEQTGLKRMSQHFYKSLVWRDDKKKE